MALLSTTFRFLERLVPNQIAENISEHIHIYWTVWLQTRTYLCRPSPRSYSLYWSWIAKSAENLNGLRGFNGGLRYSLERGSAVQILKFWYAIGLFRLLWDKQRSHTKILNNGLPQGSILAPILFNLYMAGMSCVKYSNDFPLAVNRDIIEDTERILNDDLTILHTIENGNLHQILTKQSAYICFYLHNKEAALQLNIQFDGQPVKQVLRLNPVTTLPWIAKATGKWFAMFLFLMSLQTIWRRNSSNKTGR